MQILPARLSGAVQAPPSKSAAHRAVICAALSGGVSIVRGVSFSQDILATIGAARALGAEITADEQGGTLTVSSALWEGASPASESGAVSINCRESGSTLRFFIPIAAALGKSAVFSGEGRLPERTFEPLAREMRRHGAVFSRADGLPCTVSGRLLPGRYELAGNVSSQFLTGLLFALPLLSGESEITITSTLQSAGYVAMTLAALERFGVSVYKTEEGYRIPAPQCFHSADISVEGDYSNAAFWLCAGALGHSVEVLGLAEGSAQGDSEILSVLSGLGASVSYNGGAVAARRAALRAFSFDAAPAPDLVPILAVTAAFCEGESRIENAARLRLKECDRLSVMAHSLAALGVPVREEGDSLTIRGGGAPYGGVRLSGENDHRIVMALAIAATLCREPIIITGCEAVNKSYPDFFEQYKMLGGVCHVL